MATPMRVRAQVLDITDHGCGVYTVILRGERAFPRTRPGQFLHLALDDYDPAGGFWPVSRVFSVARRTSPEEVWLVYSVKGSFTSRMSRELSPGVWVWLKLPYGSFVVETSRSGDQDVVLVAGGTGIAPYIPFLEDRLDSRGEVRYSIHLAYGVRQPSLLQFAELLSRCVTDLPGFSLEIRMEDGGEPSGSSLKGKTRSGMLDVATVAETAEHLRSPLFFLSGPPAMIRSFQTGLAARGFPTDTVRVDDWE